MPCARRRRTDRGAGCDAGTITTRRALAGAVLAVLAVGCGAGDEDAMPANLAVRQRIERLAPAANLGHRGMGQNLLRGPFPENSLAGFAEAMARGADGVELDVELTADGMLLVLHDDTLDRTTTCSGCLSSSSFAAARVCLLIDGRGQTNGETLPTLAEAYAAVPPDALVNVELKVYGDECGTPTTGGAVLARAAAAEVQRLGAASRTLFSSFDDEALVVLEREHPDLYVASLIGVPRAGQIEHIAALGFDAVHPFFNVGAADVALARALGLQVNLWTVNGRNFLEQALDKGPTAIITDEPGLLAEILAARR
jgi:glycerophosphoryl diester phosphodiesterase